MQKPCQLRSQASPLLYLRTRGNILDVVIPVQSAVEEPLFCTVLVDLAWDFGWLVCASWRGVATGYKNHRMHALQTTLTCSRLRCSQPQVSELYLTIAGNAEVPQTDLGLSGFIDEIQNRRCPPLGRFKHGSSCAVKVCPLGCHSRCVIF